MILQDPDDEERFASRRIGCGDISDANASHPRNKKNMRKIWEFEKTGVSQNHSVMVSLSNIFQFDISNFPQEAVAPLAEEPFVDDYLERCQKGLDKPFFPKKTKKDWKSET